MKLRNLIDTRQGRIFTSVALLGLSVYSGIKDAPVEIKQPVKHEITHNSFFMEEPGRQEYTGPIIPQETVEIPSRLLMKKNKKEDILYVGRGLTEDGK